MKFLAALAVACTFAVAAVAPSSARSSHASAIAVVRAQAHHARCTLRFFRRHPAPARSRIGRREIAAARRALARAELALRRLAPPPPPRPALPAHLAGWLCIHNGAYPGAPHEGRGSDGYGHSGPLQMTAGWGGYAVSDWDALDDLVVYADAERVAARYGFDPGWMRGQWPNTYPPCASRF